MNYREFEVRTPTMTKRLGVIGETHIYSPDESECAEKIVSQYDAVAMEGSYLPTRVDLALLPFIPAMLAIAHASNRSFLNPTARDIARKQKLKIQHLEPDMGKSFSNRQLLALMAIGFMSIPLVPLIYVYSKHKGKDLSDFLKKPDRDDSEHRTGKLSRINRFVENAIGGNRALRDQKMALRTKDFILSNPGDVLHVSGRAHTNGVIQNLMQLQDDNFQLTEREVTPIDPVCNFLPTPVEPKFDNQPNLIPHPLP